MGEIFEHDAMEFVEGGHHQPDHVGEVGLHGGGEIGGGDAAARSRLASGSLASTVLTLVAGMVLWFGRGPGDDGYGGGYYGY